MNFNKQKIVELLTSIDDSTDFGKNPASKQQIEVFKERATRAGVPSRVVAQLCDLYEIENSYQFEVIIGFHECTDNVIFDWWEDGELWIGQRDFNVLRWANGKFCLGDATSVSYSSEYEYETLIELIAGCVNDIKEMEITAQSKSEEWDKIIEFYKESIKKYHGKQEPMLILIEKMRKLGLFSLFYPSISHEALGLSLESDGVKKAQNPMIFIIYNAIDNNFKVQYQKKQKIIVEKNYGSMIAETEIFEFQNWFQ